MQQKQFIHIKYFNQIFLFYSKHIIPSYRFFLKNFQRKRIDNKQSSNKNMFGLYPTFQSNFPISLQTYHFVQLTRKKLQFFQNPQFFEIFLYKESKKKKKRGSTINISSFKKNNPFTSNISLFSYFTSNISLLPSPLPPTKPFQFQSLSHLAKQSSEIQSLRYHSTKANLTQAFP